MREVVPPKLEPLIVNDPNDVALKWTGEKVMDGRAPAKRRRSAARSGRRRQQSFTIRNEETLCELVKKLGITAAAVVNLGIALVAKEYL